MKEFIIINLDRYYGYARQIAGKNGNDLLHECLPSLFDVFPMPKKPDAYIYTTLRNEFRNQSSVFNKKYNPKPVFFDDDTTTSQYDSIKIHTILLKLEMEGYKREVSVFKECFFVSNINQLSKKTNIPYRVVNNMCTFVREEIKKRYVFD